MLVLRHFQLSLSEAYVIANWDVRVCVHMAAKFFLILLL